LHDHNIDILKSYCSNLAKSLAHICPNFETSTKLSVQVPAIGARRGICLLKMKNGEALLQTTEAFYIYIIFTVHFLTTHKLHTNEMHYIFNFFTFYSLCICFSLYKAILRGLVIYIYFTSIVYVCYYVIYHM
jgi:hypothetical protein